MKTMDQKKLKHDPFCWKCCQLKVNQHCSMCERSFHQDCIDNETESELTDGGKWICPVCVTIKSATIVDKQKGLQMLAIILDRVYDDPKYAEFRSLSKWNGSKAKARTEDVIVKPMNLYILKEKVTKYRNYTDFLADAKWMVHNCSIMCPEPNERSRLAEFLLDYFIVEIESVKKCAECYANATQHSDIWFTLACSVPHLMVWAKMKGFNYWPAKLMSIDGVLINVRFFGDHTHADVPATNCFLYSKVNPGRLKHTSNLYNNAVREANKYIANIRKRFGTFNMVNERISIDPTKYDVYMAEAFPDLVDFRQEETFDETVSSGNSLFEMEHVDLAMDFIDNSEPEHQFDTESNHSSHDDKASDISSTTSKRSNSEVIVKLTRIDETIGDDGTLANHQKRGRDATETHGKPETAEISSEIEQPAKKRARSIGNGDADSAKIANASKTDNANFAMQQDANSGQRSMEIDSSHLVVDLDAIEQVTPNHQTNAIEKDSASGEKSDPLPHQRQSKEATENGKSQTTQISPEIKQTSEKRARLIGNDDVNQSSSADNNQQTIQPNADNEIQSILVSKPPLPPPSPTPTPSPPPPPPSSPHQSSESDSSDSDTVQMKTTESVTNLMKSLEPLIQENVYEMQKRIHELFTRNQALEHDLKEVKHKLKEAITVQQDLQRHIVDCEGELKQSKDEILQLTEQLHTKGICDTCGKTINAVYFCDADCRATYFKRFVEIQTDAGRMQSNAYTMDTNNAD